MNSTEDEKTRDKLVDATAQLMLGVQYKEEEEQIFERRRDIQARLKTKRGNKAAVFKIAHLFADIASKLDGSEIENKTYTQLGKLADELEKKGHLVKSLKYDELEPQYRQLEARVAELEAQLMH